jgi:hypothetical protein
MFAVINLFQNVTNLTDFYFDSLVILFPLCFWKTSLIPIFENFMIITLQSVSETEAVSKWHCLSYSWVFSQM